MEKNLPFIELHRLLLEFLALAEAVGKVAARARTRIVPRTAIDRLDQHPSMKKLCIASRYINKIRNALIGMFRDSNSMLLGEKARSRSTLRLTQAYAYSGSR